MKRKNLLGAFTLLLTGAIFGMALVTGFGWVRPNYADVQVGAKSAPEVTLTQDMMAFNNAFVNVSEKVTPSIVQISVVSETKSNYHDKFPFFFPFRDDIPREQQSAGSGVLISDDGYILTNNHVVENAKQVEVALFDRREYSATVVGTDPLTDLAVIKIDETDLPAAFLGNSDNIKVGQWVMAIGNPLSLSSTVTAGIISAKGRSLQIINDRYGVEYFIQTDAAINPGNSGGALVDLQGAVIGINTAIATDGVSARYIGYGFAIPANLAKTVAEDLIANGKVSRGYIGVSISDVDAATARAVGLDKPTGVMVQDVVEDGAAAASDIKAGDIILKIDEKEVRQTNELQNYVARQRAGHKVRLTIYRDGEELERYVTLKSKDDSGSVEAASAKDDGKKERDLDLKEENFENIGLTVKDLNTTELEKFDVDNGILITDVKSFGIAQKSRLVKGFVINKVNSDKQWTDISSVSRFSEILDENKGQAILLSVVDGRGGSRIVGLEIPE